MVYQPVEELLPKAGNSIYKLIRLAATRAMELADGKPKLLEKVSSEKVTTIALEEIRAGRVVVKEVAGQFEAPKTKGQRQERSSSPAEAIK